MVGFNLTDNQVRNPDVYNENALWVVSPDGETRWTWTGPQALDGVKPGETAEVTKTGRPAIVRPWGAVGSG